MYSNTKIPLKPGSTYFGEQNTTTGPFKIDMKVDYIDTYQSFMCGTFKIYNLTTSCDIINTYYECEIITTPAQFKRPEQIIHWTTFSEFKSEFLQRFDHTKCDCLFMRIKELFILPDPTVTNIPGASIDGYYYCVYDKQKDVFRGFYYYETSKAQPNQKILLKRKEERVSGYFEFC